MHPSLSTLLDFQLYLSFYSQSEALHSSTLCPPYECRRTGRSPPPFTPHTTPYEQHTYLPTAYTPRRDTEIRHTGTNFASWPQTAIVCRIRNRGMLDLCYDAGNSCRRREADRCYVCCSCGVAWVVEGEGGLAVHRHSYRGHPMRVPS